MSISTKHGKVKNVAYNFSDAQVKVREATSNDPWGPSTALMSEIADLTHNPVAFTEIMSIVWKRLNDSGNNWRHVYKSLVLLDSLIKCGHEKVAQQCRENVFTIEKLKDFRHVEDSRDQGLNIRDKAHQITSLLLDDERLINERTLFILTRNKFKQNNPGPVGAESRRSNRHHISDSALGKKHSGPIDKLLILTFPDPEYEEARPSTATEEEMQLQIALALSRKECEKAKEMKKSNDARLQMALEESQKLLSPTNSMTTSTTNSTNGTRKTPENFLGENKNLVNLDNSLGSNAPSTAGK
ncbi:hypothetical protein CAEBREN_13681 [Caenorhabditis brenneri]|uniref:ENTH domain-containing protein n=1 Tax=Caenorhabditis brenneri TaxID=135651 RepID=G0ND88_CAEBE|nr:hypothetical protein CAEBREN_13681 [Caenorhabditis brenneri]